MTTRKHAVRIRAWVAAGLLASVLAGCATPGPMHTYTLGTTGERAILDVGNDRTAESPSFLGSDEKVTGFAYDPFTDHFFLRLEPGNRIRVVDRPARAIKREFTIEDALPRGRGDLAVRPRDGHLFLLETDGVLEITRLGKLVRTFSLQSREKSGSAGGSSGAATGLAYDTLRDRLLVLAADGRTVTVHDLKGARTASLTLAQAAAGSLAYDAERRELYASLRERADAIGVFDEEGRLLRTVAAAGALVDVGQRSFVRVF